MDSGREAILARETEEKATTATMMVACVTGSVFILKAHFMPGVNGKGGDSRTGLRESVCKSARESTRELWTITTTEFMVMESPWFIGVGKNL